MRGVNKLCKAIINISVLLLLNSYLFYAPTILAGCCIIDNVCSLSQSARVCATGLGEYFDKDCSAVPACPAAPQEKKIPWKPVTPSLQIQIPGFPKFSELPAKADAEGNIYIPFLGEYLAAIYNYAVGIVGIVAAIFIIFGGFQYITSAGAADKVSRAKETITNALIALFLVLGSYTLFYFIDPELVQFKHLKVLVIPNVPIEVTQESEPESIPSVPVVTSFSTPVGDNISGDGKKQAPADLTHDIELAAQELNQSTQEVQSTQETNQSVPVQPSYGMRIASSFRTVAKQIELINQNCQNPPGSKTCNPKPGKPQTCILINLDPKNCPHTTGRALDIWGTKGGEQCVTQATCLANKPACFQNPCQAALITAMKKQGFCVLDSEPWHFEKPVMSTDHCH